ncbi:hypothetical protein B0O80DRAFT_463671 [Mortierella sp. GBAus27b]|nr:hypothetical protein BGX31_006363 [Mortierella sp. GBA43]KAI8348103.1 hypothetical protein B0O80DRAFT_463671 [Mortierella sp. GBAus27b]
MGIKINPLDLPEIRVALAPFLTRNDLIRCVRVCTAWHASFSPILWSEIVVDADHDETPSPEFLQRHHRSIKHLTHRGEVSDDHLSIHYPGLTTLQVISTRYDAAANNSAFSIIGNHPTLTHVTLLGKTRNSYWTLPAGLFNLTTLKLTRINVLSQDRDTLQDLLSRLETLELNHSELIGYPTPRTEEHPTRLKGYFKMRSLSLDSILGMDPKSQFELVLQCPNLKRLYWAVSKMYNTLPIEDFTQAVDAQWWSELECLQLIRSRASDPQLSIMISGIPQLLGLSITCSELADQARMALRRHFAWIKQLDISVIFVNNAAFVIEVLKFCPMLESLKANMVQTHYIMEDDDAPWACEGSLKVLEVCFQVLYKEKEVQQSALLERLSKFSNLERLDLSNRQSSGLSLDFRLESGLGQLATLTRLKELAFGYTMQEMTAEDVQWMIHHWKDLKSVEGTLNVKDKIECGRMVAMFHEAGIEVKGN